MLSSDQIGPIILGAFGIDCNLVKKFTITCEVNKPVEIGVEYVSKETAENVESELKKFQIIDCVVK